MELKKKTRSKFLVEVPSAEYNADMLPWLESIHGTGGKRGTWRYGWGHWAKSNTSVHNVWFRSEQNALMFILRWTNNGR
jgi:hypothetical protein